ncbi:MAG: hypothetical protein H8M99_16130 [Gloeobacteraceae cyanobacterium ES-bin-144]|nr:hypothetical protein [Verrucomicrobiales bacterium]
MKFNNPRFYMFSLSLRVFVLSFVCLLPCFAQKQDFIKAEFITLAWDADIAELWYQAADGNHKLDVYTRGFTSPVLYNGPSSIFLYDKEDDLKLLPEKRPAPKAVAKLPPAGGAFLLLFTIKDQANQTLNVQVINNGTDGFPAGAYRVFNLTKESSQVNMDNKIVPIGVGSVSIIRPDKGDDVRDMGVKIALGDKVVYSSIWGHEESRRATVFIVPSPEALNGVIVKRFNQAVLPPRQPANP